MPQVYNSQTNKFEGGQPPLMIMPLPSVIIGSAVELTASTIAAAKATAPVWKTVTTSNADKILTAAAALGGGAARLISFLRKRLHDVFIAVMVAPAWLDFGNWESGAYSDFFQKVFAAITLGLIKPDEDWRKTKTASPEVFDKVYNTYKLSGAVGIEDPNKRQSVLFTRDNLIDLIDIIGAHLLLASGAASTKDVLLASQLFIVFSTPTGAPPPGASSSAGGAGAVRAVSVAPTKVYSGILSQGTLGEGLTFIPRPDDMIESVAELQEAAQNNLAAYLMTLPGKVVYEVKIVSSVVTRDGFTQTGDMQSVLSAYKADGTPVYKRVRNKFATLSLFVMTDKGSRVKIATIILGPTDSVKLNPAPNVLRALEGAIQSSILTTDVSEIKTIATSTPVTVKPPETAAPPAQKSAPEKNPAKPTTQYSSRFNKDGTIEVTDNFKVGNFSAAGTYRPTSSTYLKLLSSGLVSPPLPYGSTTVSASGGGAGAAGASAQTLFEWYQANGQPLPSVSARSQIYEAEGLGKASLYTGTAEQNTKLLAALKS